MEQERLGMGWAAMIEDVLRGMREWRTAHPTATFAEIEVAVDEQLAGVRSRMLEEAALTSAATRIPDAPDEARPRCETCGSALQGRGMHPRTVRVAGGGRVQLMRSYASCPRCGTGVFPPR